MTLSRGGRRPVRTKLRTAGVLSAALMGLTALSGCSNGFNPGAAATVDGTVISTDTVDSIVSGACAYTDASSSSGAATPTSLANLRLTITQAMIQFALTGEVTKAMHLSVSQAAIAKAGAGNTIPAGLSAADTAALKTFFDDYATSTGQLQLIGAHLADKSVTTSAQVTSDQSAKAQTYLATYSTKQDVSVNPAYGHWNGSTVGGGSGSLSNAVSASAKDSLDAETNPQADTSKLLATQVC